MWSGETKPLGQLLRRAPRYGINAAAVALTPSTPTYLRITDINDSGRFAPSPRVGVSHPAAAEYRMEPGELVFARTGASVGKSYLYDPRDGELIYAGFLINIAPDPSFLNPKFLSLLAQTEEYWNWIARTSVRSGQPGVNGREFASLPIPVIPLEVQNSIVAAISDADELIESTERLIAKKQAIKQGLMQHLLTGRVRLPGFNEPWTKAPLGTVAKIVMGQSPVGSSYNNDGRGLPLIQGNADIRGRMTIERIWTVAPTKVCRSGDVILTVRAPVGYTAIARNDACLGRGVCSISASDDNRYLFHSLVYAEPSWNLYEQGSTFTAVNSDQVRKFAIAWPTDQIERHAIAEALDEADEEIATLDKKLAKAKLIKRGMMQELLTGRTRLPAMETAS